MEQFIVIDFIPNEDFIRQNIKNTFQEYEIIESDAFSGTEIITVLISTSALVLDKILNFYLQNRKNLKETSLKIGKDTIELSGFTDLQIKELLQDGSIEKLKELSSNE